MFSWHAVPATRVKADYTEQRSYSRLSGFCAHSSRREIYARPLRRAELPVWPDAARCGIPGSPLDTSTRIWLALAGKGSCTRPLHRAELPVWSDAARCGIPGSPLDTSTRIWLALAGKGSCTRPLHRAELPVWPDAARCGIPASLPRHFHSNLSYLLADTGWQGKLRGPCK